MQSAQELKQHQLKMKLKPTEAEREFEWLLLNLYQNDAYYKTQEVFGNFILDFVALPQLLVIEVDGQSHIGRESYDNYRDEFIRSCGLTIVHVSNEAVFQSPQAIVKQLLSYPVVNDYERRFRSVLGKANAKRSKDLRRIRQLQNKKVDTNRQFSDAISTEE